MSVFKWLPGGLRTVLYQWTPGRGHFWPQGYNLNNLVRDPLDKAVYKISKTWAFWFRTSRFLKAFPI